MVTEYKGSSQYISVIQNNIKIKKFSEFLISQTFLLVDYLDSKLNTLNLQIPLRYEDKVSIDDALFWPELMEEIAELAI